MATEEQLKTLIEEGAVVSIDLSLMTLLRGRDLELLWKDKIAAVKEAMSHLAQVIKDDIERSQYVTYLSEKTGSERFA